MSLTRIEEFKVSRNYGYQIVGLNDDGTYYSIFFPTQSKNVKENTWERCNTLTLNPRLVYGDQSFIPGFHLFYYKKDAKFFLRRLGKRPYYVLRKVRFKGEFATGIVTYFKRGGGIERETKVVVSEYRKILSEEKL